MVLAVGTIDNLMKTPDKLSYFAMFHTFLYEKIHCELRKPSFKTGEFFKTGEKVRGFRHQVRRNTNSLPRIHGGLLSYFDTQFIYSRIIQRIST